jgi:hypothetical protein
VDDYDDENNNADDDLDDETDQDDSLDSSHSAAQLSFLAGRSVRYPSLKHTFLSFLFVRTR